MEPERYRIFITGIVQGVGFRPFVFSLARSLFLSGYVRNTGNGVQIELECSREQLDIFISRLKKEAPSLAVIRSILTEQIRYVGDKYFRIEKSIGDNEANTLISPDVSICKDCSEELLDMGDYRYHYPFINCTNCGPRFTIIKDVPYDRPNTTMKDFIMCEICKRQYGDPHDRRYHAQPIACELCGPKLSLINCKGEKIIVPDMVKSASGILADGKILAIKGLGGYHLACDASNGEAVIELRKRKHRDEKPFAVMARDLETVYKYCDVNYEEKALLESVKKPIVLLRKRQDCTLPDSLAPGNPYLGIMLPYTPLQVLLFDNGQKPECPDLLVMTSGNISNEPICYKDSEAFDKLSRIADYIFTNDREIHIRTDDSVTRVMDGKEYIIRRSRGYVPLPVFCDDILKVPGNRKLPMVLACGGELKNTFCLNKGREFYLSHHIGDLENLETLQSFEEGIEHFKKLFGIMPELLAHDLHPEYLSTKYAMDSSIVNKFGVQHHKAHIASCMAENDLDDPVIGVAFDGTGYGEDGRIWGGEFFVGTYCDLNRAGHLPYVRMPGGSIAIKEPWRMAAGYLNSAGIGLGPLLNIIGSDSMDTSIYDITAGRGKNSTAEMITTFDRIISTGFNSPLTSSMGRLFDAVSALAGVRHTVSFEGQAAMELEFIADTNIEGFYPYTILKEQEMYIPDVSSMIGEIIKDRGMGVTAGAISSKFHETMAIIVLDVCMRLKKDTGLIKVVLSGGVFQNTLLLSKCIKKLEKSGFDVYIHSKVPANDGGISLGQSVIAMAQWQMIC